MLLIPMWLVPFRYAFEKNPPKALPTFALPHNIHPRAPYYDAPPRPALNAKYQVKLAPPSK